MIRYDSWQKKTYSVSLLLEMIELGATMNYDRNYGTMDQIPTLNLWVNLWICKFVKMYSKVTNDCIFYNLEEKTGPRNTFILFSA